MTVQTRIEYIDGLKILVNTLTWPQIKELVLTNRLESFARSLDEARKYRSVKEELAKSHKSLYKRLLCLQLGWAPKEWYEDPSVTDDIDIKPKSSLLFHDSDDVKIVPNDFPYNFEASVTHLLAWTKVPIEGDPLDPNEDISPKTRALIDLYVQKTFVEYLGVSREDVVWFRNWRALQSVRQLSHIHVLINGLSKEKLNEVLNTPGKLLTEEEIKLLS